MKALHYILVCLFLVVSSNSYSQELCPGLPLGTILNLDNKEQILYSQEEYRQALLLFACSRELSLSVDNLKNQNRVLIDIKENLLEQKEVLKTKIDLHQNQLEFTRAMRELDRTIFDKRIRSNQKDKVKVGVIAALSGGAVGVIVGVVLTLVLTSQR